MLCYSFYTQLCVNNVEITVNTCTCTDVFTVITTKDQSGWIIGSYSTGGQRFMAVSKQTTQAFKAVDVMGLCCNWILTM